MDEQKKMFTNKSVTLFLVIVISVSAIFETIVIALRAMGLAVFFNVGSHNSGNNCRMYIAERK